MTAELSMSGGAVAVDSRAELGERVAGGFLARIAERPEESALIRALLGVLARRHPEAGLYACGGLVRDLAVASAWAGEAVFKDLDLVVEGVGEPGLEAAVAETRVAGDRLSWRERVGVTFPVWKLKTRGMSSPVDLALVRTERSYDTTSPGFRTTEAGATLDQDAQHRDFTINALYLSLESRDGRELRASVRDPVGGLDAVLAREIRAVGSAEDRFREDPLRMLRAVRFAASLRGFAIAPETAATIARVARQLLPTVASDRVAEELRRSLVADARRSLAELGRLELLPVVLPDLDRLAGRGLGEVGRRVALLVDRLGTDVEAAPVFAALLLDLAVAELAEATRSMTEGRRVPPGVVTAGSVSRAARHAGLPQVAQTARLCSAAVTLGLYPRLESADAVVEEVLDRVGDQAAALALYAVHQEVGGSRPKDFRARMATLPQPGFDFGELVGAAGLSSGPHLHRLKLALRQAEIEGRVHGRREALELLRGLSGAEGQSPDVEG